MNKVALLEFVRLVFNTSIILDDKLEDGRRTSLDKIDIYFYKTISSVLRVMISAIYLSSEYVWYVRQVRLLLE